MNKPSQVWIDMQLPPALAEWWTQRFGMPAVHFATLGFERTPDDLAFEAAKKQNAMIVTKDVDFATLVQRLGAPPQIIWLRCGNTSVAALKVQLEQVVPIALQLIESGEALIEVAESRG